MNSAVRLSRRSRAALALAGVACLAQSFSGVLPSQVVCLRGDRPAQAEFFSFSCSCRHESHSCAGDDGHDGFRIVPGCVDIQLNCPALQAAAGGGRSVASAAARPRDPATSPAALFPGLARPRRASSAPGLPWRGSPPFSAPSPRPGLRC